MIFNTDNMKAVIIKAKNITYGTFLYEKNNSLEEISFL